MKTELKYVLQTRDITPCDITTMNDIAKKACYFRHLKLLIFYIRYKTFNGKDHRIIYIIYLQNKNYCSVIHILI